MLLINFSFDVCLKVTRIHFNLVILMLSHVKDFLFKKCFFYLFYFFFQKMFLMSTLTAGYFGDTVADPSK